jgi:hypothetical protein
MQARLPSSLPAAAAPGADHHSAGRCNATHEDNAHLQEQLTAQKSVCPTQTQPSPEAATAFRPRERSPHASAPEQPCGTAASEQEVTHHQADVDSATAQAHAAAVESQARGCGQRKLRS